MLAAVRAFAVLCVVGVIALVALLALNVMQLSRTGKTQVIVVTATPQPTILAQAAQPTVAPLSGATLPNPAPTAAVTPNPAATATTVPTATPAATATTASSPTPVPTATPSPKVLYQADWSGGAGDWATGASWKTVGGMLVNDGTDRSVGLLLSPFQPGNAADYAVEAEIQFVRTTATGGFDTDASFGLATRLGKQAGYRAGYMDSGTFGPYAGIWPASATELRLNASIARGNFAPKAGWHVYRLEVRANTIRFLVDNAVIIDAQDNLFLAPGQVGIWCDRMQINIRSFKVLAL